MRYDGEWVHQSKIHPYANLTASVWREMTPDGYVYGAVGFAPPKTSDYEYFIPADVIDAELPRPKRPWWAFWRKGVMG